MEHQQRVTSLAEVWIEISNCSTIRSIGLVTSLAEVWIEIYPFYLHRGSTDVTSLAEVWIEMSDSSLHPLPHIVTSLAEVWIEILTRHPVDSSSSVTSLAEVWIEILSRSTYGNPRSKCYHHKYYKDLLKSLDLPDIHFHQLRNTYATILLKNSFNSKGVSHLQDMPRKLYPQMSMEIHRKLQKTVWTYWNHLLKKLFQKRGKISIMIIQK